MIVGLPQESDADIDELVRFATELSKIVRTRSAWRRLSPSATPP